MNSNFQSHHRSTTGSATAQTPSVPLSVYRELAAELQTTRAMVESLHQKNQQLGQENQFLRQEIHQVVQSVMALQPLVGMPPAPAEPLQNAQARAAVASRPTWQETAAATQIASKLRTPNEPDLSQALFTEETPLLQKVEQTKSAVKFGGLWLTLTILAIIVTAFGAGFLIMRPFLPTAPR